jgi:diadenosine tetraphosphate (Ap4A) HIT family hydrolase
MSSSSCPFCELGSRIVAENEHAVALRDREPASPGHTLIVPKRHCRSFFELTEEEALACYQLLRSERERLARDERPDGWNVGVNEGTAAGQSVEHAHVHLIPRYRGDHPDPRGGVRHVIPTRR